MNYPAASERGIDPLEIKHHCSEQPSCTGPQKADGIGYTDFIIKYTLLIACVPLVMVSKLCNAVHVLFHLSSGDFPQPTAHRAQINLNRWDSTTGIKRKWLGFF